MYDLLNKNFHIARFPLNGRNNFLICKINDKGLTDNFLNEKGRWGHALKAKQFASLAEAETFISKNNLAMLVIP